MSFFAWYLLIGVPLTGCFGLSFGVPTVLKMRKFRSSKWAHWNSRGLLRQAGDGMRSPCVRCVGEGGGQPTVYIALRPFIHGEATQGGRGGLPTGNFGAG